MLGIDARFVIDDVVLIAECRERRRVRFTDVIERPAVTVALLIEVARIGVDFGNRTDVCGRDRGRRVVEILCVQQRIAAADQDELRRRSISERRNLRREREVRAERRERARTRDDFERAGRHERVVRFVLIEYAAAARVDREKPDVRTAQRFRRAQHAIDVHMEFGDLRGRPWKCGEQRRQKRVRSRCAFHEPPCNEGRDLAG